MMKRFTQALVLFLALALLAGCTGNAPMPTATAPSGSNPQNTVPAAEPAKGAATAASGGIMPNEGLPIVNEPVTLSVWSGEIVDNDYWTNISTVEYEKMTGVKIDWKLYSSSQDGNTAYNLLLASQDYPDIIARWFSPEQINVAVEANAILPLTDMINSMGTYYRKVLEEQPQYLDMLTSTDGNIYTFMYTDSGVHKDSEYKMWVYQQWLDQLGMSMPTTPEEFKNLLIAIRDTDLNGNGQQDEIPLVGYFNGRQSDPLCFLMNPFQLYNQDYFYISDDAQVQFIANTDGFRDGLRYLSDLYNEGLILEETYVQDKVQFQSLLNRPEGETIVGTFPLWYQGDAIDATTLKWTDYSPVPPLKGSTGLQQSAARKGGDFKLSNAISTQSKNPEVAFKWLDYMLSDEGLMLGHYGIEGISYEWVDKPSFDGAARSINLLELEKPRSLMLWNSGTFPRYDRASVRYGTTFDESKINDDNTYVLLNGAKAYEPYYVWHNIPNVVWCDDNDLIARIAENKTLFKDHIGAAYTAFILGNTDINDDAQWQSYLDSLESLGLQSYLADLQTYYATNK